jgi:hypothetical protein
VRNTHLSISSIYLQFWSILPNIHSILVGTYIYLFIFNWCSRTIWPRTNYRRDGWGV